MCEKYLGFSYMKKKFLIDSNLDRLGGDGGDGKNTIYTYKLQ